MVVYTTYEYSYFSNIPVKVDTGLENKGLKRLLKNYILRWKTVKNVYIDKK